MLKRLVGYEVINKKIKSYKKEVNTMTIFPENPKIY